MKSLRKPKPAAPSAPRGEQSYLAEKHLRKFCSVTSHELGNVLGAIVGELDFALSSPEPGTRDRALSLALEAAEKALTLARNLRYFAVHTRLDAHSTDVSQVVLDAIDIVEKELDQRSIRLAVFVEATSYAHLDPAAFQQVILNLLANAAHAMPSGGKLTVSLRQLQKQIQISITDTGTGIPASKLEHLFEPYFFASMKPPTESLGLGLAVAKALVEAHGGEITAESEEGVGTTFLLHLPLTADEPRPTPFPEKRRFRRVSLELPVDIETPAGSFRTELVTLSVGGGFALLPENLELPRLERNASLRLKIYYYGEEAIELPKVRVANLCRVGARSGIGLEFLEVGPKAKKLLSAIVRSHSS